ncbi:hypothetical protein A4H96_02265 [Acidithiobacillus ferrooxidans]|uniref:Uncharacterized protein n=1 Tax=Acidithiobacillus ferrooxidans TaxID=920 RepID=A0A179BPU5_ACIFR|nr:hypothetical protein A4H96_02265 [Acidithiobacillus ferrooxidans]
MKSFIGYFGLFRSSGRQAEWGASKMHIDNVTVVVKKNYEFEWAICSGRSHSRPALEFGRSAPGFGRRCYPAPKDQLVEEDFYLWSHQHAGVAFVMELVN